MTVVAVLVGAITQPHLENLLQTPAEPRTVFHAGELRVGLDPSRPPFAFFTEDGQYIGLEVDLGRALADEIGVPLRFVGLGFDGLYDALKTNNVDVVIAGLQPVYHIDGNAAVYSTHYFDAGLVLVSEAGFEDMHDLPGHALAYEFGSPADATAQRWLRRVRPFDLRPYELPEYALDAVRVGEADAALVDATTTRLYLREHQDFNASAEQITHAFYTVTLRNDRPDMLAVINDTLQQLYDDGTLDAILDDWL
ncbi:MAG: transporter substrate-binding domain-containing protein [Chloroflexota bacterium]